MKMIELVCPACQKPFLRAHKHYKYERKKNPNYQAFCSQKCLHDFTRKSQVMNCEQCGKSFEKQASDIKQTKHHFCSHSCAATYSNTHKTTGTRRSKLEKWIEEQLMLVYPTLGIQYNSKEAINSELDIFIPSIKLAIELNGIFHYEPIYGAEKLASIQNNDGRKFQACLERGIELVIIDTTTQKRWQEKTAKQFFDIITNIIDRKLNE